MNDRQPVDLDGFETALLAELRLTVARRAASTPTRTSLPVNRRSPWRWRLPAAAVVAAVVAVVVAVVLLVPVLHPTPAYAVTGGNGSEIHVQVTRLGGAAGLEKALRKRGIPADVTYLPPNKQCAPQRYEERRAPGLTLGVSADEFEVTIPPGAVRKGDTFVLSASVVPLPDGVGFSVDFGVADGPVKSCQVMDGP